jgi:thiamine transport system ATP-binding protein
MLAIEDVSVRFDATVALDHVSLAVNDGERLSILGPSGSGKSTLLRAISGLEPLASGRIYWDGQDLANTPTHRRRIGLMFQDYVLFPHLDVAANVRFGLDVAGLDRPTAERRVAESLALVGLDGYEKRSPAQLSGGEQQRVALARALAPTPRLLMLDEPLGALDRALRRTLLDELDDLFGRLGLPIMYVTHDHEEALAIGDRVAVMRDGRLEALSTPHQLWAQPPSEFVARFLGMTNIFDAQVADGIAATDLGRVALNQPGSNGNYRLLIRPDGFRFVDAQHEGSFSAIVRASTFRGDHTLLRVQVGDHTLEIQDEGSASSRSSAIGEEIHLAIDPSAAVLLPLT